MFKVGVGVGGVLGVWIFLRGFLGTRIVINRFLYVARGFDRKDWGLILRGFDWKDCSLGR